MHVIDENRIKSPIYASALSLIKGESRFRSKLAADHGYTDISNDGRKANLKTPCKNPSDFGKEDGHEINSTGKLQECSRGDSIELSKSLAYTPSMIMLTEAAEALSESPSSLVPMDALSTGGVYQLRRQKSVYFYPDELNHEDFYVGSVPSTPIGPHVGEESIENRFEENDLVIDHQENNSLIISRPEAGAEELFAPSRQQNLAFGDHLNVNDALRAFCHEPNDFNRFEDCDCFHSTTAKSESENENEKESRPSNLSDDVVDREGSDRKDSSAMMNTEDLLRLERCAKLQNNDLLKTKKTVPRSGLRRGKEVAIFKPEDEETGASKYLSRGYAVGRRNPNRAGLVVGGGARRECAAYLLDKQTNRFSGVPETALVSSKVPVPQRKFFDSNTADINHRIQRSKVGTPSQYEYRKGSLQRFCHSDGSAEDHPDLVSRASSRSVHAIAILDLRIFNTDRHGGNILCRQTMKENGDGAVELIPIDHALSLPNWHYLSEAYFVWYNWPQASVPLEKSVLELISKIDIEKDSTALRKLNISEGCITTNKICTMSLKQGASHGLTLKDLSEIFQRPFAVGHRHHTRYASPLEQMISEACAELGIVYPNTANDSQESLEWSLGSHCGHEVAVGVSRYGSDRSFGRRGNVDVADMERRAFDNTPPPRLFFTQIEKIFDKYFKDGLWRNLLHLDH